LEVLQPHRNGTYCNFPFQPFGNTGRVSSTVYLYGSMRTCQVPRNIIYLLISLVCWPFLLQSNKPQFRALLPSNLAVNYYSTTKNLSPLCISTLSISRATPSTPSPLVNGRQRNGFYFSLADQFKILGR